MGQNNFSVENSFFIIDSDNLESVKSKLYGYCIINGYVIEDFSELNNRELTGEGSFVYIERTPDKIIIKQDFVGSYGIYIYREKDYYALSNSFLMLEEYLKNSHRLTLNKEYADYFLAISLASNSYSQTIVNEISEIDRSATIEINIKNKSMSISYHDYQENTVELNSKEGMEILDKWFKKWTNIINNLYTGTGNIQTDLTGGFDSRMTFGLFLGSDIDLSNLYIRSVNNTLHTHKEDYEIASDIGNYYGFSLNNTENLSDDTINFTTEDILNISFYTKLSFHKQMYFKYKKHCSNRYRFTGGGGESIREHWNMNKEEYLADMINRAKKYTTEECDLTDSITKIINSTFAEIEEKYRSFGKTVNSDDIILKLYRDTRCRNHFGKDMVEYYFSGVITLLPLLDPDLQKLKLNTDECTDKNLLMTVMLDRYNSKLLDFKFDSNRHIDTKTISYAKKINAAFPFTKKQKSNTAKTYINNICKNELNHCDNELVSEKELNNLIKKIFSSGKVRKTFELLYGEKNYNNMVEIIERQKFHPLENAFVIISISKILHDEFAYTEMHCYNLTDYLKSQLSYPALSAKENLSLRNHPYIDNYITARIDIKNSGSSSNDIKILKISDHTAIIKNPDWFQQNGKGYVVESKTGKIEICFSCINSGDLNVCLRSLDIRDNDNERIPFWIDFKKMSVNNKEIFNDTIYIWHNRPFKYTKSVKNNEVIKLELQWLPHVPVKPYKSEP